ncbi:hypothetical protein N7478_010287 [Penicillium angulare]|uniref:uncharacterized protein n=1 Tax=Penicillium angulare TaxID=116970 RepID=UPI0025419560|nr:uncharacterized protein N7478_010287 [Penicillium angulare]KAJ5267479.1 hypothetical protein N7478_010287 [Penicillium angulare]
MASITLYSGDRKLYAWSPLDVGCFAVLKRSYGRLVDQQTRIGINHIDKFDFLEAYPQARADAYQAKTIQNAFKTTGLAPLDAGPVLLKLNIQLRSPTPITERPTSKSSIYCPETPTTILQLSKHAKSAKKLLKYRSKCPPTPTKEVINQAYKACEQVMQSMILIEKEIKDLRATNKKQLRKKRLSRKEIVKTGGMFVYEAHEQGIDWSTRWFRRWWCVLRSTHTDGFGDR